MAFGDPWSETDFTRFVLAFIVFISTIALFLGFLGERSGGAAFDVINNTWALFLIALFGILLSKAYPRYVEFVSLGSYWRALYAGAAGALAFILIQTVPANLSFSGGFFAFQSVGGSFSFLTYFAPLGETVVFVAILFPTIRKILLSKYGVFTATISSAVLTSATFAGFHYFTYYSLTQQSTYDLMPLLFRAFLFNLFLFIIGSYVFGSIMFAFGLHAVHNLFGYIGSFGIPKPDVSLLLIALFAVVFTLAFAGEFMVQVKARGLFGALMPSSAL